MTKTRLIALPLTVLFALGAVGCSQKYGAERDGKNLGQAICDLRTATTKDEAARAVDKVENQLGDLSRKYAIYTAEDKRDVDKNLADLAEHSVQGNDVLKQQDLAVLQRSATNLAETNNEVARAVWDGVLEGLADCTQ